MLLKFFLAITLLSITNPESIKIIDTHGGVKKFAVSDSILKEVDKLISHLEVYIGFRIPEGTIIKIPLTKEKSIIVQSNKIIIKELTLLKTNEPMPQLIVIIYDHSNRPHLFLPKKENSDRFIRLLK